MKKPGEPLPEVGAASNVKILPDATEISWRAVQLENPNIDFFNLSGGKTVGTAYAASFMNSANDQSRFIETDGFLGSIWLNYALSGGKLLHRRVDYAYSFSGFGSGKNYTIDDFIKTTRRKFQETQTFNSSIDLRINAADFTPPWTNLAGNVERLESNKPQIRVTGQAQDLYFDALAKEIAENKVKPPVTSRDKLFFHVGVMAARSDLKVAHRLTENMTLKDWAEKGYIDALLPMLYSTDYSRVESWARDFRRDVPAKTKIYPAVFIGHFYNAKDKKFDERYLNLQTKFEFNGVGLFAAQSLTDDLIEKLSRK